jgi:hypothetical protein
MISTNVSVHARDVAMRVQSQSMALFTAGNVIPGA